ncbi:hypothetical protein CYMTET_53166 [Cymbomonas tetramitiformis]|uniref:Uncharacterized protein n=1 Tax=Cymbomonas tetramitiformis TaxID=36881 RepID=A0AAE0ES02_9CHLO|nr:hypothetical protein CYMTET_53166 [Cymbomonas tetramitiformis]
MRCGVWAEQDAEIPDASSKNCKMSACDNIFVAVNYEEKHTNLTAAEERAQKKLAEENDDRALMRFEFIEAIVRLAIAKHGMKVETDDASESVDMLVERHLIPSLCPESVLDPNTFREKRLYFEEMDIVFTEHCALFQAVFDLYTKKGCKKRYANLPMEGFLLFLEEAALLGNATGMSKREYKLVFIKSQMAVVDEIKQRSRAITLTFVDFLEAMGRTADWISMPTQEALEKFYDRELNPPTQPSLVYEFYTKCPLSDVEMLRRDSSDLMTVKTRMLWDKMPMLIELIVESLRARYGGSNESELVGRLKSVRNMI